MSVYLQDPDVTLYHGDVLEQLASLPDESVHCVVTSPPYWGLRDYGTGAWQMPDCPTGLACTGCHYCETVREKYENCDHMPPPIEAKVYDNGQGQGYASNNQNWNKKGRQYQGDTCGKCGAQRTDQQLGLEPTPDAYIERMVAVFREVRRVLRKDGTCWVNIGDAYASQGARIHGGFNGSTPTPQRTKGERLGAPMELDGTGIKPKDLVGIPWRLAFALQADGWWLRADIIWAKPNPMPESVTDRPTKAHEYVFLLTKSPRYFFDQEAVRETSITGDPRRPYTSNGAKALDGREVWRSGERRDGDDFSGRNVRSVWTIATEPYPDAHFATFPTELARRCILAGTSERGCCPECGAPWVREVAVDEEAPPSPSEAHHRRYGDRANATPRNPDRADGGGMMQGGFGNPARKTLGWRPSCDCGKNLTDIHSGDKFDCEWTPRPCRVLDPFVGSGTVPHVARLHNRHAIGIDLNADYLQLAARRLQQQSLFASSTEGAV